MNHLQTNELQREARVIRAFTIAAAILGVSLWIGLMTPLSWSSALLNLAHYCATLIIGVAALWLSGTSRQRITSKSWLMLAPSLVLALITPLLALFWLGSLLLQGSSTLNLPPPHQVVRSPNGCLVARVYNLGPGFGGGTRATVHVSRCWLPGIVEDMGTVWAVERGAEALVEWEGNSAVRILVGETSPVVPLNMFQFFPKSFIVQPIRIFLAR